MAKPQGMKHETKSDFLRKVLGKNPDLDHRQVNQRWVKTGHTGAISTALYYHLRAELGIKSEGRWVKESEPESKKRSRPSATTGTSGAASTTSRSARATGEVYQLKVTLVEATPPIWRRIQVQDCTLDTLHGHIQTAMGWTNSHLHDFTIHDRRYGDPMLMEENFEMFEYADSTKTMLSEVVPPSGEPFRFVYQYDFGDSWEHEILFEGRLPVEPGKRYPLCVEGARACPPEDVGGVVGYEYFLEAIGNPKHEAHDTMTFWIGENNSFDPEAFDPVKATSRMKQGLPDWREMP